MEEDMRRPVLAKVIVPGSGSAPAAADGGFATFRTFDKALYLLRDPRDWMISGVLFLTQEYQPFLLNEHAVSDLMGLLRRKEAAPASVPLLDILSAVLAPSGMTAEAWLPPFLADYYERLFRFENSLESHLCWRYEDFVANRNRSVERHLGFRLDGDANAAGRFDHVARAKRSGDWRHWLTEADVAFLRPLLTPYIRRHGYPPSWSLSARQQIDTAHASGYVERVVTAKRRALGAGVPV
jgi:hypothetical protein